MSKLHPLIFQAFKEAHIDPSSVTSSRGYWTDGQSNFFVKTSTNIAQLKGEHASLTALNTTAPAGFVPRSFGVKVGEDGKEGGMVSEYFDMGGKKDQKELGKRLAEMHRVPQEGTEGYTGKYGFSVPTHCGVTEQDNTWTEGWKEFFVQRRAGDLVRRLKDREVTEQWERMQERVIPLLLDDIQPKPRPVVIHGDLWSGNVGVNRDTGLPVIFDPSSCYAHNEFELGICSMFGGFTSEFFEAYHSVHPRSEKHYDQRLKLYELYHHLNHALMFGGSYKNGALRIMSSLIDYAASQ